MTNPRRRFLYSRQDDPDEYRPGRTESIGCWRLGHGWTATESYTGQDKAMEPSPTLPVPQVRKPRAKTPQAQMQKRRRKAAKLLEDFSQIIADKMVNAFTQIITPPPPPVPPNPDLARLAGLAPDDLLRLCSG